MAQVVSNGRYLLLGLFVLGLIALSIPALSQKPATAAVPPAMDDEVVLPSRVGAAMDRTASALDRSESRIDDQQYGSAAASLSALDADLVVLLAVVVVVALRVRRRAGREERGGPEQAQDQ